MLLKKNQVFLMLVRFLALLYKMIMKNVMNNAGKRNMQTKTGRKNISYNVNKHRPEIRDDLDSRENEEQHYKGNDVTQNRMPHHSQKHTT